MAARSYGQYCGVTTAVELLAERWALLIVRDLLVGPRRYTDLQHGLPRIPTNILSARLKELQDGGVVRRVPRTRGGLVYAVTDRGRQLEPIVLALSRWGFREMGEPGEHDVVTADSLTILLRSAFRPEASTASLDFQIAVGTVALRGQITDATLSMTQIAPPVTPVGGALPAGEPALRFAAEADLRALLSGTLTAAAAVKRREVILERGGVRLLGRFLEYFRIEL